MKMCLFITIFVILTQSRMRESDSDGEMSEREMKEMKG